jgi:two-component system LytT family sensor kinase
MNARPARSREASPAPSLRPPAVTSAARPVETAAQTSEYSIYGLTREVDQALIRERRVGFAAVLFIAATAIAVLYSLERYLYSRWVGEPVSLRSLLPAELVFTYTWALLAPLVMRLAQRFPLRGREVNRNLAIHMPAMLAFVLVHASLFSLVTVLLAPGIELQILPSVLGRSLLSWTVVDAIVYCALVTVNHAVIYYRVSKDRALRASQLEASLAQAQLQMLRMQLQPHFLFNTLHSISALMHKDVRRADSMVAALSDLLRMSLQNIGAQEVALQSELDFLQRYVEIMRLRFGERLKVSIDIDPETRDARVPNLFFQPLVENSFRHGFGDLGQGSINITIVRDGDMLRCDVIDDGRGLRTGHKDGVGLATTRQRLAHLYGDNFVFSMRGAPNEGVHVTVVIPFNHPERMAAD